MGISIKGKYPQDLKKTTPIYMFTGVFVQNKNWNNWYYRLFVEPCPIPKRYTKEYLKEWFVNMEILEKHLSLYFIKPEFGHSFILDKINEVKSYMNFNIEKHERSRKYTFRTKF